MVSGLTLVCAGLSTFFGSRQRSYKTQYEPTDADFALHPFKNNFSTKPINGLIHRQDDWLDIEAVGHHVHLDILPLRHRRQARFLW